MTTNPKILRHKITLEIKGLHLIINLIKLILLEKLRIPILVIVEYILNTKKVLYSKDFESKKTYSIYFINNFN